MIQLELVPRNRGWFMRRKIRAFLQTHGASTSRQVARGLNHEDPKRVAKLLWDYSRRGTLVATPLNGHRKLYALPEVAA